MNIAQKLVQLAQQKNIKISVAESITGGRIAAAITSVSGASGVFMAGVVAYNEHTKIHALGVDMEEIHATGGYSEETARQMAERVRSRNISDIAISTTGCSGPNFVKGFEDGRVLFALAQRGKETIIFDEKFSGEREEVQQKATEFALEKLREAMSEK